MENDFDDDSSGSVSSDGTEYLEFPLSIPTKTNKIYKTHFATILKKFLCGKAPKVVREETLSGSSRCNKSTTSDESNTLYGESKWTFSDEESSFYKDATPLFKHDTTCCDEDFTWVRSESSAEKSILFPKASNAVKHQKHSKSSGSEQRRVLHSRRQERDFKSRSANSLREKSSSGELFKGPRRDGGGCLSESYANHPRGSPGFWDFPPPPPVMTYPPYDMYHYWGCHSSREDIRGCDYQRRCEVHRYGSNGALPVNSHDPVSNGGFYPGRYPPPWQYYDHKPPWNFNQKQDVDERIQRLHEDKDALALQVQILTDQVSTLTDKIVELEKSLTDKTQVLSNTEDMLQREMLTRSSLETQKLELMSAMSELKLQQAALERENLELRASQANNNSLVGKRLPTISGKPSPAMQNIALGNSAFHGSIGSLQQHSNNSNAIAPKTPPASFRHQVNPHFNSLPRTAFASATNGGPSSSLSTAVSTPFVDNNANPKQRNVAFGKNLLDIFPFMQNSSEVKRDSDQFVLNHCRRDGLKRGRGFSVPNLAENEKYIENSSELMRGYSTQLTTSPPLGQKSKGLRGIFGRMRRSNSGNLEDLPGDGEFKRGGVRATAGPRLGWSQNSKPMKPFKEWDVDDICVWFDEMGLSCYEEDVRRWLKKGSDELIKASPVDIEKELNLKSSLHRKKIVLSIGDLLGKETDEMCMNAGKLDTSWVMRWLDDIGLPQHKDSFSFTRIDGRMLHKLTLEDLANLHITSCLHVASLRRGIQVMRENRWNPDCLIRRSSTEVGKEEPVALWTAHRVMEWLRVVDLAEYAPNLRGAGVHGALMIYEPKFTAELLADLLSIPPSKTLLRRHLATHFKELLGRDVIQKKRDVENTLGYQPLTITAKVKTPKKSQFSLKRKKSLKSGDEWSDYVCPMGQSGDHLPTSNTSNQSATGISMTNSTITDTATEAEAVSLPTSCGSPTSMKSSNSTS